MDAFGICANSAFEEKMEVEMIYFWKDGEFSKDDVCQPPPLHVAKAKQLKQKKSNYNLLHVHDRQFTLPCFVFPVWKRELSFAVTAVVFLGFNLLNARRGVKPTLATLGARLVVVIRSCWIFAW